MKINSVILMPSGNLIWRTDGASFSCECIGGSYSQAIMEFIRGKDARIAELEGECKRYDEAVQFKQQVIDQIEATHKAYGNASVFENEELLDLKAECERLREDAARLDFVDKNLCMAGAVMDKNGQVVGIRKRWQVVTQYNDSLREMIDILSAQLTKEPNP